MRILPVPLAKRTRATAVLRRPVPRNWGTCALGTLISAILRNQWLKVGGEWLRPGLLGWGQRCRLLGGVGVLAAFVHFKLRHQDAAQSVLLHHPAHGVRDQIFRLLRA